MIHKNWNQIQYANADNVHLNIIYYITLTHPCNGFADPIDTYTSQDRQLTKRLYLKIFNIMTIILISQQSDYKHSLTFRIQYFCWSWLEVVKMRLWLG